MTLKELKLVTDWLKYHIIQNPEIMFSDGSRAAGKGFRSFRTPEGYTTRASAIDLVGVIVYLHNRLSEEITGSPYNYMFHWANKIGSWVDDCSNLDQCIYNPVDENEDL